MRFPCLLAACAVAAPLSSPALAGEGPDGEIVVTGQGLPDSPAAPAYGVQQIERDRLGTSASGRIEDVLSGAAGFQQFRRSDSRSANPSAQGVTLRALGGNATSRTLVLLDGVPMADPMFGYIPLSAIAPERLARARVVRGGGSGAFGAGAVAGTIELDSADAALLGLFSAEALGNDRGETALSATLAPQLGSGFAVASARWDRGRGFWTTPVAQRGSASARAAYESWSASLRGVAPLAQDVELQVRGLLFDDRRTLRFAGADSTSSGQDASLRLVGRGDWAFDVLGYLQARDFSNVVISSTNFRKSLDQRHTPSTGLGGKIELRPPVGAGHVLRLGADLRHAQGELQEDAYSTATGLVTARRRAGGTNRDIGLFAEHDWTLGQVVLTGGARADRWSVRHGTFHEVNAAGTTTVDNRFVDRSGWETSLRGGAVVTLARGLSLRAAGYSGVRMPTLNELYRPFVVFPVTTFANAGLRNERLRGFEGGLDLALGRDLSLSLTGFDNKVRDAVGNVTCKRPGEASTCETVTAAQLNATGTFRERRNLDAIHARGIEMSGTARAGAFSVEGSLAWTRSRVEASGTSAALDGMRPAQTPAWSASGTVAWRPAGGWQVSATLRHVGAQFEDDVQTDVLGAATTLDAFAQVPLGKRFRLVLRGENLTDAQVVTRNQAGSIDLGAPRTVWAGLRVELR